MPKKPEPVLVPVTLPREEEIPFEEEITPEEEILPEEEEVPLEEEEFVPEEEEIPPEEEEFVPEEELVPEEEEVLPEVKPKAPTPALGIAALLGIIKISFVLNSIFLFSNFVCNASLSLLSTI